MTEPIVIDEAAALLGGRHAGEYLDEIGKSDLATLTREEWATFCTRLVRRALIAAVCASSEPPF